MPSTSLLVSCGEGLWRRLGPLVPPQVRLRGPEPLQWRRQEGLLVWEWEVPAAELDGLQEVLPCLSTLSAAVGRYRFTLEYRTAGDGTRHQAALDPLGPEQLDALDPGPAPPAPAAPAVETAIDVHMVRRPLAWARLRLCVSSSDPAALGSAASLVTVSLRRAGALAPPAAPATAPPAGVDLAVPPRSQMGLRPDLARRVCSPTCVSMVLQACGRPNDVYEVIARAHHPAGDLYGVWPANVQAAAHWGVMGYLLHVPAWEAARYLLDAGVPLIASVQYEEGELGGAAVPRTAGHLVVVRGYGPDVVLVNDPAAAVPEEVPRRYDLQEFLAVWLGRSGVAYVLFPP